MKCKIHITGEINGNFKLRSKLNYEECKKGMFNSFILSYNRVKDAKQAIKDAYKNMLLNDTGDWNLRKSKDNTTLYYDASKAEIIKN